MPENTLYFGDNLDILRRYVPDESVDLIYLDPPFNSNQAYNVIFEEEDGAGSGAQIEAFDDTWHWTMETARCFEECVEAGGRVSDTLMAFRKMLGETDMMAEELLEGASIDFPYRKYGDRGFKKAPKSQQPKRQDRKLIDE